LKTYARPANSYKAAQYSVTGLLVHVVDGESQHVTDKLNSLGGVEVHGASEEGNKLVVTVEEFPGEGVMIERITDINNIAGVVSASLVYTERDTSQVTEH